MLTGKLVRARYARDRIVPIYLDEHDPQSLELAGRLVDVFRAHLEHTRGMLEDEIDELFGDLPQPAVHQGLAKLLEDRCDFEALPGLPPAELREKVFAAAARQRVLQAATPGERFARADVVQTAAVELGLDPGIVEAGLFADLKSEQRLVRFDALTPERLVERYNVALAQAVLLRATRVVVLVRGESPQRYRQLFRQIKFRRLICEVQSGGADTYRLQLDGPLSLFSATQKYGLQLALFLPTLLLCRDFTLDADLRWGADRREKRFVLTPRDGLVSHQAEQGSYVPPEIEMFVEQFRKKAADWEIRAESEVVALGQHFWVPDFCLVHRATGRSVLLDVLGFWRRSSVERHLALLREHADRPFLIALGDQLRVDEAELAELPGEVMRFRHMPLADEVVRRANQLLFPE